MPTDSDQLRAIFKAYDVRGTVPDQIDADLARRVGNAFVAVTGAGDDGVFRAKPLEAALTKKFDASALDGARIDAGSLMSDMHASADYRAHLVVVMAKRAVAAANG